jgi:hypothetical protein
VRRLKSKADNPMNPQAQSNPPFEPVTVPDTEGEAVTVKVANAYGKPAVWIHERDHDTGITLLPEVGCDFALAVMAASASAAGADVHPVAE